MPSRQAERTIWGLEENAERTPPLSKIARGDSRNNPEVTRLEIGRNQIKITLGAEYSATGSGGGDSAGAVTLSVATAASWCEVSSDTVKSA